MMTTGEKMKRMLPTLAKVLLICVVSAALVLAAHLLTKGRIAANAESATRDAIVSIFGSESIEYKVREDSPASVSAIYEVYEEGALIGHAVLVSPQGFGGPISLMVGSEGEGRVVGALVMSHSETPRYGAKACEEGFLSQFSGMSEAPELGKNVDAVSGATISSEAVTSGVNTALDALREILGGGESNE